MTRFLARFPLSPQLPADSAPLLSRIAKCAKSASASAASSSSLTIIGSAPAPLNLSAETVTEDADDEEEAAEELGNERVVSEQTISELVDLRERERERESVSVSL